MFAPLALGIGYFIFCSVTISHQYTFDAISYLWDVENTRLTVPLNPETITYNFFHSQHLLFSLFVYFFYHLWEFVGYHGPALLPAQVLNLLEGSLTLGIVCALLQKITKDTRLSVLCSMLLGCSYAFWDNTAMISDHMASCLLAATFFITLVKTSIGTSSLKRIAFLGFLSGAAILMHQVNGLLGIMFLGALSFEKTSFGIRFKALLTYVIIAGLTATIPYLIVGIVVLENTTPYDFIFWCFYYAMPGVIDVAGHYGTFSVGKIIDLFTSFGASFVGGFYWMNSVFETRVLQRFGVPILSAVSLVAFLYIMARARIVNNQQGIPELSRKVLRLSAIWFLAYVLLLFWWWPTYYQLWAVPLVAFVIFVATFVHVKFQSLVQHRLSLQFGLVVLVLSLFTANLISAYLPLHDIDTNDYYITTIAIGGSTAPDDVIVIPGNDEYETYIPYFVKRKVVSLHAVLIDHLNNIKDSFAEIETKITEATSSGHDVFIVSELHDSVRTYADVYELHHLKNEDVAPFFHTFGIKDTLQTGSLVLYKLGRKLPAKAPRQVRTVG